MEKTDTWHTLEIATEHLSPRQGKNLQIPSSCTWCGAPGKHPHRVRVEGPGLLPGMREIALEVMLCPDCYRRQKMIEISGWVIMVAAMSLYVVIPAMFENISGLANALLIVVLLGAFFLASWRWWTARLRRGIHLKPSGYDSLLLSVHNADWLERLRGDNPGIADDRHPSTSGK